MPIQSIPFEILQEIFQYLSNVSLLQCATINKSWNAATTRIIHETVDISRGSPKKVLSYFMNQKPETNTGSLARKLKISSSLYGSSLDQQEFLQLLSCIPFIKSIEINTYMSHQYLEYLSNRTETSSIQYLEELLLTDRSLSGNKEIRQYFSVAYGFRNTLKNLILRCPRNSYEIHGPPGRTAVSFLNEFVKLTHLSIDNQHGNSDPNLSLFAILQSCPNLISFMYKSDHLIPQDSHQSLSANQIISVKMKKLQKFKLYLPNISGTQLNRILSYLPLNGLIQFVLHLDNALSGVWVQEQSKESVTQLGKYLGMAKQDSEISILNYGHQREYTLGPTIPSSIDMMSGYYPLLDSAIDEGRSYFYHVHVDISDMGSRKHSNNVIVKKKKDCVFLSYKLDITDVQLQRKSKQEEEVAPLIDLLVPTNGNLASGDSKVLSSMEIMVKDEIVEDNSFVDIVHSAITNCPRLKFISVSGNYCKGFCLQFGCSEDLLNWDWNGCFSCRGVKLNPYCRKPIGLLEEAVSTTAKDRIKYILMANTQVRTIPLKSVTDVLPNIKILKFVNCLFERDDNHNYTIDISGIEHLDLLALDMYFMEKHRRYVFIKLEMSDEKQVCFKACGDDCNFTPTTVKFMNSYKRFTSIHSSTIIIKCQKIDKIDIYMSEDIVISTISF